MTTESNTKAEKRTFVPAKKPAKVSWSFVTRAELKNVRVAPQKARLVMNLIKGKPVGIALQTLDSSPKKTAKLAAKLLRSAIANVNEAGGYDVDKLFVARSFVGMGRTLKRFMPRAQGRASPIRKRSAHLTVQLAERVKG